jgi:alkanesulfonate monooxygenase SsuD/methylene tetrahydromethanopterin reductase-like flavin-dependent oxidoreductase (luciferase family)
MKFGVFYEMQLPKPWAAGDERRLFHEALAQVELADALGYDYAWEVEHHFLDEYSHSSAPEVFLRRRPRTAYGWGMASGR